MPRTTARFIAPEGKKWCPRCERYRDKDKFDPRPDRADELDGYCHDCRRAYDREWSKDRDRKQEYRNLRNRVLDGYGGVCVNCNEKDYSTLVLEYVGTPSKRVELKGVQLYSFLVSSNFPPGWRVLCRNCFAKKKAGKIK